MVPVAQFGKTWAVTFRFKPFPVAQRQREGETETETETEREREGEREGLGDMSTTSLPKAGTKGGTVPPLGYLLSRGQAWVGWGKTRVLGRNGETKVPALLGGRGSE